MPSAWKFLEERVTSVAAASGASLSSTHRPGLRLLKLKGAGEFHALVQDVASAITTWEGACRSVLQAYDSALPEQGKGGKGDKWCDKRRVKRSTPQPTVPESGVSILTGCPKQAHGTCPGPGKPGYLVILRLLEPWQLPVRLPIKKGAMLNIRASMMFSLLAELQRRRAHFGTPVERTGVRFQRSQDLPAFARHAADRELSSHISLAAASFSQVEGYAETKSDRQPGISAVAFRHFESSEGHSQGSFPSARQCGVCPLFSAVPGSVVPCRVGGLAALLAAPLPRREGAAIGGLENFHGCRIVILSGLGVSEGYDFPSFSVPTSFASFQRRAPAEDAPCLGRGEL
ncbi:hypothetical protein AK812_SmicGene14854 [Symbiodinium microadriaticum]|uniref:Uncharacterized protein n=1 Tax=Symbiodinium microadriaticum TaxID=2951 RepID=A0A1Q9E4F9_SYMMI|nr:hypothetical protein AK812_SmicGene14854 [Symbiodinium microadriaticum]